MLNGPTPEQKRRVDVRLPLAGVTSALFTSLPQLIFGNDIGAFLLFHLLLLLSGILLIFLCVRTLVLKTWSAISMLLLFVGTLAGMHYASAPVRNMARWRLQGSDYRSLVLSQKDCLPHYLKHAEWDGWGFAGAGDTTVYLVFDPDNSLASSVSSVGPVKVESLPCEVYRVHRMEDRWYTVQFYTDTDWEHCG